MATWSEDELALETGRLLAEAGYPVGDGLPELVLWYKTNDRH